MHNKFNPTLSFDGVAMIIACITGCLWIGSLSQRVSNQEVIIADHATTLKVLSEGQRLTSQNLAILQQLVIDRLGDKR